MNHAQRARLSLKSLLLVLLVSACMFGIWRAVQQANHYGREVERLSKMQRPTERRAHEAAKLEVWQAGSAVSSPASLAGSPDWFGGTIQLDAASGPSKLFSYKGRHLYSVGREDIYLFYWTSQARLPPVPSPSDPNIQHRVVAIASGVNIITTEDDWEPRIVAP